MRVRLKGIFKVKMTLADGSKREYHYAWRGGPRLQGKPGSPEYLASFTEAHANLRKPDEGTMRALVTSFKETAEYTGLSDASKRAYTTYLDMIRDKFGDLSVKAIESPRVRGFFKAWRDTMASKPRKADYAWSVLARVLSVAKDRGKISVNPCERGGRLYKANRADSIWTEADLMKFFASAPAHISSVVLFALWTGQRQGDILAMPWSAFDGQYIRFRQSKTGASVTIPIGKPLADHIATLKKRATVILTTRDGNAWSSDGFRASYGKAFKKAGLPPTLNFHDLRGTAVTRLALAGCSEIEIAAITGHSISDVKSILERHYLGRNVTLAENAIAKLMRMDSEQKKQNEKQNGPSGAIL